MGEIIEFDSYAAKKDEIDFRDYSIFFSVDEKGMSFSLNTYFGIAEKQLILKVADDLEEAAHIMRSYYE